MTESKERIPIYHTKDVVDETEAKETPDWDELLTDEQKAYRRKAGTINAPTRAIRWYRDMYPLTTLP